MTRKDSSRPDVDVKGFLFPKDEVVDLFSTRGISDRDLLTSCKQNSVRYLMDDGIGSISGFTIMSPR